jgi:hypothetical protein
MDFRLPRGPNYISAAHDMRVTVLLDDRNRELLTIRCWRYQAALTKLLSETQLLTLDNKVKIVTKVVKNTFSPLYTDTANPDSPQAVFRKEVVVELEVEHYEQF